MKYSISLAWYAVFSGTKTWPARSTARYSITASTLLSTCTAMRLAGGSSIHCSRLAIIALPRSMSPQV
jgi:hypothetical protein